MPDAYHQLLDATIQHLEALKARGRRFLAVRPESLRVLTQPVPRPSPVAAPVAAPVAPQPRPPQNVAPARPATPAPAPVTRPSAPTPAPLPYVPPTGPRAAAYAELRARALACVKCAHLAKSRKNVVFGVGNIEAALMFVGEAPGADEDVQGEPFVGAAGQLLTRIIKTMGLERESVYIANILKCRPDTPAQSSGNRAPRPDEMAACIPFLHQQIDLIQPRVLVALGGTAVEGLLGKKGIMSLRGNWHTYRNIPLMPTYHPAYLLRNQSLTEKRKLWEDMLAVMEKLEMSVSDKQRNFFLK